ncbi:hypothetical protein AB5I41_12620 [Sphingomonas sp. MMS24-JH45]
MAGGSFLAEPAVRALVERVVDDPLRRERVLDRDVTATPIVRRGAGLLSFGREGCTIAGRTIGRSRSASTDRAGRSAITIRMRTSRAGIPRPPVRRRAAAAPPRTMADPR